MTIREAIDSLPNGLHDARLFGYSVDYANRIAKLTLAFDATQYPDSEIDLRRAELTIESLRAFIVRAPDSLFNRGRDGFWMCDVNYTAGTDPDVDRLVEPGVQVLNLFVNDWNAEISALGGDAYVKLEEA